jgi:hypothetical protein
MPVKILKLLRIFTRIYGVQVLIKMPETFSGRALQSI